jgi:predicted small lipoprotein YifL
VLLHPLRLAALAALVVVLAACGVKGPLEPPPAATNVAPSTDAPAPAQRTSRRPPPPEKPDQPFILDSIL